MKIKRLTTMLLTATLLVTSILVACRKQEQPDWREEVTSVLSGQTSSKSPDRPNVQSSTATTVTTDGVTSDPPHPTLTPRRSLLSLQIKALPVKMQVRNIRLSIRRLMRFLRSASAVPHISCIKTCSIFPTPIHSEKV